MTDMVRSDARQGATGDAVLVEHGATTGQDERVAEAPLWLTLLARWGSAGIARRPRDPQPWTEEAAGNRA